AFAEADLAHGKAGTDAAALARNADAFIHLHAGAGALGHLIADAQRVAGLEIRKFTVEGGDLLGLKLGDQIHRGKSFHCSRFVRDWSDAPERCRSFTGSMAGGAD